jgi:hypothetical protein
MLIERRKVVGRRRKVGTVENIEELCPELSVESFRDTFHSVVLENGEIQLG